MKTPTQSSIHLLALLSLLALSVGCAPPALYVHEAGPVVAALDSDAAIPTGMRLTANGWEDASQWHISTDLQERSIGEWIEQGRRREPGWMRLIFSQIRETPPLMIAVIQITAIAAIVHLSGEKTARASRNRSESHTVDCT